MVNTKRSSTDPTGFHRPIVERHPRCSSGDVLRDDDGAVYQVAHVRREHQKGAHRHQEEEDPRQVRRLLRGRRSVDGGTKLAGLPYPSLDARRALRSP